MKVRIKIDKTAALLAGLDEYDYRVVDIPAASLTEAQREMLARYGVSQPPTSPMADFYLDNKGDLKPPRATPDIVRAILDRLIEIESEKQAKAIEEHEESVRHWLTCPIEEWVRSGLNYCDVLTPGEGYPRMPQDDRLADRRREAESLRDQILARQAAEKAQQDADERELQARIKAGSLALRQWAETHGSELLRERLAGGYEWEHLAEREYCERVIEAIGIDLEPGDVPAGFDYAGSEDRTCPKLEEIRLIKTVDQLIEKLDLPATACLKWVTYIPDEDAEKFSRPELAIEVTAPNGKSRSYDFVIPSESRTSS